MSYNDVKPNNAVLGSDLKNITIVLGVLAIISIFIVLVPYLITFHGPLSENVQDWASFGSYAGGLLGPILTSISVFLIVITIILSLRKFNDDRNQQSLDRLYTLIFKVDEELAAFIKKMPSQTPKYDGPKKKRPPNEFITLQIANIIKLQYHWLNRVSRIDKYDALAIHVSEKNGGLVNKLEKLGWFKSVGDKDSKIVDFYNRQAARLFRTDI